ncbi:hypothetical protein ACH3VR_21120 [Microbacterium sp. B2969]|uniref:Gram-positive cocci surface proteins LPxTG domain-containing protein n=1 Tax=Microbacterium alkaliflavum TaxID=3248839 RepID=A0ABW7QDB4_9MICO
MLNLPVTLGGNAVSLIGDSAVASPPTDSVTPTEPTGPGDDSSTPGTPGTAGAPGITGTPDTAGAPGTAGGRGTSAATGESVIAGAIVGMAAATSSQTLAATGGESGLGLIPASLGIAGLGVLALVLRRRIV